jgi:uncharacterized protein YeaO (DUF488 family)
VERWTSALQRPREEIVKPREHPTKYDISLAKNCLDFHQPGVTQRPLYLGAVMFDSEDFSIKRIYAQASPDDGTRILVDRLWPRGIAKDKAKIDLWLKDIAPSNALRKRFHGEPDRWDEFCSAYAAELDGEVGRAAVNELIEYRKRGPVTLLYAARNKEQNNAVALKAYLVGQANRRT